MSTQLKTPGVYIEEISKLPPSVAQVETAIPAFTGYTEKATSKIDNDLNLVPTRIVSMLEYVQYFGGGNLKLELKDDSDLGTLFVESTDRFLMYYSLQMYFANGGGPCYIVSVNTYGAFDVPSTISKSELSDGLNTLEREDEPTLLLFPDAISLDEENFYALYSDALLQANKMQDRFVIMDTYEGELTTVEKFRAKVAGDKYGAVYYPHLNTTLTNAYSDTVQISHVGTGKDYSKEIGELQAIITYATNQEKALEKKNEALAIIAAINETLDDTSVEGLIATALSLPEDPVIADFIDATSGTNFQASIQGVLVTLSGLKDEKGAFDKITFGELKADYPFEYAAIETQIKALPITLPPSSAIAGIYAKTDSTRGVWKSPANVGLSYVSSLTDKINNEAQEGLNVDSVAGKSINAIREFQGKGIIVWGARTLDGNSNEWRYIQVRRFFNMVEESVKNAVEGFVFDSNDANTWVKVQAMIENFLNQQWRAGALTGATPKEAYFVSVGLDKTMTAQDILEGKMIVEIGMAAVRPAEFIILQFSHKLQES